MFVPTDVTNVIVKLNIYLFMEADIYLTLYECL
jgi:hypothetical protein